MMDTTARRPGARLGLWTAVSAALHGLLVIAPMARPSQGAAARSEPLWMDPIAPPPAPAPPPEEPKQDPPRPQPRPERRAPLKAAVASAREQVVDREPPAEPASPSGGADVRSGDGTLAVASGTGASGSGNGSGNGMPGSLAPSPEPERKAGPAQFSLRLDVSAFERLALVRPGIALLMAVPGFRDMLRGSGIRPFVDLRVVRLDLPGLTADRLALAGVHGGGEQALFDVATRIAAMRNEKPIWRGDGDLRASAWVDGTGFDRGFAVHDGAFVIAARAAMPGLLGTRGPAQQILRLSSIREDVALQVMIEDASRYLTPLESCALQALRVTVVRSGDGGRLALTAHYRAASFADRARTCMSGLGAAASQLSSLREWLARAASAPGRNSTSLEIGVTSADIERLLNELAWALRSA